MEVKFGNKQAFRVSVIGGLILLIYGAFSIIATLSLQAENKENELSEITKNLHAHTEYIEDLIERGFIQSRSLRSMVQEMRESDVLSRVIMNQVLKSSTESSRDFLGLWMVWEPNSFDQNDVKEINGRGSNNEGRYVPYWHWQGDSVVLENCVLFDESDYYQLPKKSHEEHLLEPYNYPVSGNDSLLVSVVSPILKNGVFLGVAGADISLSSIKKLVHRLGEIEKGKTYLISGKGVYIVHPDPKMVGKIKQSMFGEDEVTVFSSEIEVGFSENKWKLLLEVPEGQISSEFISTKINIVLFAGISASVIFLLIIFFVTKQKEETQERQKVEEQLYETDAKLVSLLEGPNQISTYSVDKQFRYTGFNTQHKKEMEEGFHVDVEVGKYLPDLLPEYISARLITNLKRALKGEPFEQTSMYQGEYYNQAFNPIFDKNSHVVGVTSLFKEVTTEIKAEMELEKYRDQLEDIVEERTKELRQQKEFFQKIIDQIPALIFVRNEDGIYDLVNRLTADSFGRPIEEVTGKSIAETHNNLEEAELFKQEDETLIQTGVPVTSESKVMWPDGTQKWLYLTKSRMFVDTKPFILGIHVDVTHLKETQLKLTKTNEDLVKTLEDLKSTQLMLIESEKMASIGLLTAGLAHEINNPINYVAGNISVIKRNIGEIYETVFDEDSSETDDRYGALKEVFEEMDGLISGVEDGTSRVINLIRDLSAFSRPDLLSKDGPIQINECVTLTVNLIKYQPSKTIEIETDLGDLPIINGSSQLLKQVLLNMLTNACQAIESSGKIKIRTFVENNEVHILISDSGSGIQEDHLTHVFEPFFTTKEVGEGTGLGLSISYNIIKEFGGRINVVETSSSGTTFNISLPIE
ncbi:MAG: PAS domain S-box protein [Cyclobacteriaceae bacterium]